jgi:hypothetical protein
LHVGDVIKVGAAISVGANSLLDLGYEEAQQLWRLMSNTTITFDADGYSAGAGPSVDLTLTSGKICGISDFPNDSFLEIQSEYSWCVVFGPGRVDFIFDGSKGSSLSGFILTSFAMGTDRCRPHYLIHPERSEEGMKPERLKLDDREAAFLKDQLSALEASAKGGRKLTNGVPQTTRTGKRVTPL